MNRLKVLLNRCSCDSLQVYVFFFAGFAEYVAYLDIINQIILDFDQMCVNVLVILHACSAIQRRSNIYVVQSGSMCHFLSTSDYSAAQTHLCITSRIQRWNRMSPSA